MTPRALLLGLVALLPLPALAQQPRCDPNGTQMEINACAYEDYARADAALNAEWKHAKAFADQIGAGKALLSAQRAWITYRDGQCEAEAAAFAGGSIQPTIRAGCLSRMTQARTVELFRFRTE